MREAARIQSFPDRFRFAGSRSDAFRQVGKAVPPLMAEAVAGALSTPGPVIKPSVTVEGGPDRSGRSRLRTALEDLALTIEEGPAWFAVPTAGMTNLVAAVVALLTVAHTPMDSVAACVSAVTRATELDSETYADLAAACPNAGSVLARLAPIVGRGRESCTPESVVEACDLTDRETSILLLLLGNDVLVRSNPVLRAATRLTAATGPETGTAARMHLATVVGGGHQAARRMAALLNIATTTCGVQPLCDECPLRDVCPTAATPIVPAGTPTRQPHPAATAP